MQTNGQQTNDGTRNGQKGWQIDKKENATDRQGLLQQYRNGGSKETVEEQNQEKRPQKIVCHDEEYEEGRRGQY